MIKPHYIDAYQFDDFTMDNGQILTFSGCEIDVDNDGYGVQVDTGDTLSFVPHGQLDMVSGAITLKMKTIGTPDAYALLLHDGGTTHFELLRGNSDTIIQFYLNGTLRGFTSTPNIWDGELHTITIGWFGSSCRLLVDETYDTISANARSNVAITSPIQIGSGSSGTQYTSSKFYEMIIHNDYDAENMVKIHNDTSLAYIEEEEDYEDALYEGVFLSSISTFHHHYSTQGIN